MTYTRNLRTKWVVPGQQPQPLLYRRLLLHEAPNHGNGTLASHPVRVSLLGHDLRAAMSDIIGGLRLIDHTSLDAATRLQLERVRTAGEALARLLDNELASMQGETSFSDTQVGNVHLSRMLSDLHLRWAGRAQEKGLSFRLTVAEDVPSVLTLDRIALERVLSNILSNAIKYTDRGDVRFSIDLTDDRTLRFVVSDDGPGFSQAILECLFNASGRPEGHGKPGHGLGMHISRDMAARLGARIQAGNLAQGGASVTVLLPADAWAPRSSGVLTNLELPDLSKVRVLLAEDSPTNQAVVGNMLAALGAEYEIAADGVEAMHWLDRERFDIALLDIEMPRMSGLEVLRAVRACGGALGKMPILAITAYVLRTNREAIYAAGATGILAKPVLCIETFGQTILRSLNRHSDVQVAELGATLIDHRQFENLLGIAGPDSARELLFRLETDLRKVERGLIVGLAETILPEIRAQTHVLIALAGAVGAGRLQHLAEQLNSAAHDGGSPPARTVGAAALQQLDLLIQFISQERARRLPPE